jgi:hypothetical protein
MTFALNLNCDSDVSAHIDFVELRTRELVVNSSRHRARRPDVLVHGVGVCDAPASHIDPVSGELEKLPSYATWTNMLARCYSPTVQARHPTYIGVTVCPEWLHFSNFKTWFDDNYMHGYEMDKDILVPGNRVYGPTTCCYLPGWMNNLITDGIAARGATPLGVHYAVRDKKFVAQCHIDGKQHFLGYFANPSEAHRAFQVAKADAVEATIRRYTTEESVISLAVVKALHAYADRLRADAALGIETLGYSTFQPLKEAI